MIPIAAVLVEGHNDDRFRPILTQLDFAQQLTEVAVAREHVGIARVLVFRAEGLVEDDVREIGEAIERPPKLLLIFQMFATAVGVLAIVLEIGEGLMVGLKVLVRGVGVERVVPAPEYHTQVTDSGLASLSSSPMVFIIGKGSFGSFLWGGSNGCKVFTA